MPITKIPTEVSVLIHQLVITNQETLKTKCDNRWHKKLLNTAVRHLEYYIKPRVSIKAAAKAKTYGIDDLSIVSWKPKAIWEPGKELLFEHAYPVSDIVKNLLKLNNPSIEQVVAEISKAEIVWILREEDKLLKKFDRENWLFEYAKKGIQLVEN